MNHRAPVSRAPMAKAAKAMPTTVGVSSPNGGSEGGAKQKNGLLRNAANL